MEIWKDIEGYEGLYQVSNEGRVRSIERTVIRGNGRPYRVKSKILKQCIDDRGYLKCYIGKIHRLVAEAFIPNPNQYETIHHINHNKLDNNTNNLVWMDNITHNRIHGGKNPCKIVVQSTLNDEIIKEYPSVHEAARENGINCSNIARCCRKEQTEYKGFKWNYK